MVEITFIIPKYRMAKCNRRLWKSNKHKRPFYFVSEINKAVKNDNDLRLWFGDEYKGYYKFKR